MTKPRLIREISTERRKSTGKSAKRHVCAMQSIALGHTDASAVTMQVGTPIHGRAKLVQVNQAEMANPRVMNEISTVRSQSTG